MNQTSTLNLNLISAVPFRWQRKCVGTYRWTIPTHALEPYGALMGFHTAYIAQDSEGWEYLIFEAGRRNLRPLGPLIEFEKFSRQKSPLVSFVCSAEDKKNIQFLASHFHEVNANTIIRTALQICAKNIDRGRREQERENLAISIRNKLASGWKPTTEIEMKLVELCRLNKNEEMILNVPI